MMRFVVAVVLCGALMGCGDDAPSTPFHADDVEAAMRANNLTNDDQIAEQLDYFRGLCTDELDLETQYGIAAALDAGPPLADLLEVGCPGRVAEVLRP